ncbi:hypothetical protein QBC40DRAFT_303788 [Triangularia verruculosa]|uniref:Uncharacterized protein n=1 Tax=Triangularia verruculosa TaxID=2587418 RepID=A0AAN7AYY6_9PEZI|nr:hypothetical protein QBC40DRAFT_303788 [Triangularia verruculosa]
MRRLFFSRPLSFLLRSTASPAVIPRRAFRASAPLSTANPSEEASPSQPTQSEQPEQSPIEEESSLEQPLETSPYTFALPLSSTNHNSLTTFLSYASRNNVDPTSTVYIGTHFEYTAILSLSRLCFTLHRVGGRSDYGIDLLGFWSPIPGQTTPLKVLGQCKSTKSSKPSYIRELEGAFIGAPPGWRSRGVIGILVAEKTATKGVRDAIGRSKWPMVYVVCSKEGMISQMLWNQKAVEEGGLEGLGVGSKHRVVDGEQAEEVMLTWRGKEIKPPKVKKSRKKKDD